MHISTSFIKIALLSAILLSGCATHESKPDKLSQQDIDKALKETTESDIQKYRDAIALLAQGELVMAKSALIEFTEDRPELAGPWANLALISIKQGKLDKAEALLHKAIERNPKMSQAFNLMGYIEKDRGNILKAKDFYTKAIKLKNNYAIAHYNLALLYDIYIQDIYKAVTHYQKYMALTKHKDKRTADWLGQLKASLKKG